LQSSDLTGKWLIGMRQKTFVQTEKPYFRGIMVIAMSKARKEEDGYGY